MSEVLEKKLNIIPLIDIEHGADPAVLSQCVQACEDRGADAVMLVFSRNDDEISDNVFKIVRACARLVNIPILVNAYYQKLENAKKLLYAGADKCVFFSDDEADMALYPDAMLRFGIERCVCYKEPGADVRPESEDMTIICETCLQVSVNSDIPALLAEAGDVDSLVLKIDDGDIDTDYYAIKYVLKNMGYDVSVFESDIDPDTFHWDDRGLIPCVVQDATNGEVLMMAYMNKESYEITCRTGRMTYWSRSRKELWIKGDTSGHYQYVVSMDVDCDEDTLLAKVRQVGAACHTGNRSCFYRNLFSKESIRSNPETVLRDMYSVVKEQKGHPKDNVLGQGLDKILKKVAEEASDIIIAAKNPDPEEVIYETSDLLYHLMSLMAEKDISWDDIVEELSKRESAK